MTPLTYTIKGNLPCSDLRLQPEWEDTPDYTKVNVRYFLGDEEVRNDVYVYSKRGVTGEAIGGQIG